MPLLNPQLSIVEVVALGLASLFVLVVLIGFFANLPALLRYFRMRRM
jgi:hypothetical protein